MRGRPGPGSQVLLVLRLGALTVLLAAPARAAETPVEPDTAADAEIGALEELRQAELSYAEAMADFKAGRTEEARRHLRAAFSGLAGSVSDDGLAQSLRPDFLSALEKARTYEGEPEAAEEPGALDADPAQLAAVAPAAVPEEARREKHGVPVDADNETVKRFIALYTAKDARRRAVEEALGRAERYKPMMTAALRKAKLPEELFWLVMTESEYKMKAVSGAGAAGLWQFMPGTARKYGLEVSYWVDERMDPEKATGAAVRYLKDLKEWFGDWPLALAGYNRGEGGVGRDMQSTRSADFGTLAGRGGLPNETQNYVPKFMACVLLGEHPERYGLKPVPEAPSAFDTARVERDLDLEVAAKAAGTDLETLKRLNPELRAWCTPKGRAYGLRVPAGSKDAFLANLASVKEWNPGPKVVLHKVQKGEFL
ncbi:hypothetical protein EPO15_02295, partial [bacterium]